MIDPAIIDFAIESFCTANPPLDYLSNTVERTYPRGLDVEVFSVAALNRAYALAAKVEDLEHVTRYIYTHPDDFKISQFKNKIDHSEHRWTVDTKEDFDLAQKMLTALSLSKSSGNVEDCLKLLEQHPEWALINSHIKQKA